LEPFGAGSLLRLKSVFELVVVFALITLVYDRATVSVGLAWLGVGATGFDSLGAGPIGTTGDGVGAGAGDGVRVSEFVAGRIACNPSLRLDSFEAIPPAFTAITVALNVEPESPVLAVKMRDAVDCGSPNAVVPL
jgi:hypothetical protein